MCFVFNVMCLCIVCLLKFFVCIRFRRLLCMILEVIVWNFELMFRGLCLEVRGVLG